MRPKTLFSILTALFVILFSGVNTQAKIAGHLCKVEKAGTMTKGGEIITRIMLTHTPNPASPAWGPPEFEMKWFMALPELEREILEIALTAISKKIHVRVVTDLDDPDPVWGPVLKGMYLAVVGTYAHNIRNIVSGYVDASVPAPEGTEYIIMTVPVDKQFILTDIVVEWNNNTLSFYLMENDIMKLPMSFYSPGDEGVFDPPTRSVHFNSGIPFAPETNVILHKRSVSGPKLTISGYEIDH